MEQLHRLVSSASGHRLICYSRDIGHVPIFFMVKALETSMLNMTVWEPWNQGGDKKNFTSVPLWPFLTRVYQRNINNICVPESLFLPRMLTCLSTLSWFVFSLPKLSLGSTEQRNFYLTFAQCVICVLFDSGCCYVSISLSPLSKGSWPVFWIVKVSGTGAA